MIADSTGDVVARVVEASHRCSRSSFGITTPCAVKSRLTDKVRPFVFASRSPHETVCVDIREFTPSSWRNIIGIVPQVRLSFLISSP